VQCKQGFEKEVVISLLQKALCKKKEGDPLSIFSATASENLKGYFYVEAYKENHVRTAIQGMRSIFKTKISLVPIKEMAEVYNIIKANKIEVCFFKLFS
jgi:transcription elongation factor SPT5